MFLDSFSLGDYMSNSKSDADLPGTMNDNKSAADAEHVSWMRPSRNRNERITIANKKTAANEKSKFNKADITISKPTLQRSSLVLDKNMVRDYNLALKHLSVTNEEKETLPVRTIVERSGSESNVSLSESDSSRSSSIFDKNNSSKKEEITNLRSIFFNIHDDDNDYVPSDTFRMSTGKCLIQVYDSKYARRLLAKDKLPVRLGEITEDASNPKYERTILEF